MSMLKPIRWAGALQQAVCDLVARAAEHRLLGAQHGLNLVQFLTLCFAASPPCLDRSDLVEAMLPLLRSDVDSCVSELRTLAHF